MDSRFQHVTTEELTQWLSDLIKIKTVPVDANEIEAANYIKDIFESEGLKPTIYESDPGRATLYLRIPGKSGNPKLMLSGHIDVVPAETEHWKYPPYSGEIVDGEIWGRGAIDCKGLVVMMMGVVVELTRSKTLLEDDLVILFLADEEAFGQYGAKYMVEQFPDLVNIPYVIQEGGGMMVQLHNDWYCFVNNAEKGAFSGRIHFLGVPGHGSMPRVSDNPVKKLAKAIELLSNHQTEINVSEDVLHQISEMSESNLTKFLFSKKRIAGFMMNHPPKAMKDFVGLIDAMIRPTIAVTMLQASDKINVIPGSASLDFDCRVLPGQGWQTVEKEIARALKGKVEYKLEHLGRENALPGNASTCDTPMFEVLSEVINSYIPNIKPIPFQVPGATDSRFFREHFGSIAYGFMPLKLEGEISEFSNLVHGRNERLSIENLQFGSDILLDLTLKFLGDSH